MRLAAQKSSGYANRMRIAPTFVALIASCLLALPAQALVLPPAPEGTCPLDSNQAPDRAALAYMHLSTQTPATIKALFAECKELTFLRAEKLKILSHYGTVFEQKATLPAGVTRAQAIEILGAAGGLAGTIAAKSAGAASLANSADAGKGRKRIYTASEHGVLLQNERTIILGSEQRHLGPRLQYAMAAVTALTVVDGHVIAINLYTPLTGTAVFAELTKTAETYVNSLLAANP